MLSAVSQARIRKCFVMTVRVDRHFGYSSEEKGAQCEDLCLVLRQSQKSLGNDVFLDVWRPSANHQFGPAERHVLPATAIEDRIGAAHQPAGVALKAQAELTHLDFE